MITIDELKQTLSTSEDYQTLVRTGVMPEDLRWEPQVNADTEYEVIDGKASVIVFLEFSNYPGAKPTSKVSRKIQYAEFLSEQDAYEDFPDDSWSADKQGEWEYVQLKGIVNKL